MVLLFLLSFCYCCCYCAVAAAATAISDDENHDDHDRSDKKIDLIIIPPHFCRYDCPFLHARHAKDLPARNFSKTSDGRFSVSFFSRQKGN
jgi:hypothetical protein